MINRILNVKIEKIDDIDLLNLLNKVKIDNKTPESIKELVIEFIEKH